jgi:hypothetical protein
MERWSSDVVKFGWECRRRLTGSVAARRHALRALVWARPMVVAHAAGTGVDVARSRAQLLAENAPLRQQLVALRRGVKRPTVEAADRALLLVRPATPLRWHRAGFRTTWTML